MEVYEETYTCFISNIRIGHEFTLESFAREAKGIEHIIKLFASRVCEEGE